MIVYVTGGEGFIGTNLCNYISSLEHKVISVDNRKEKHTDKKVKSVYGDVRQEDPFLFSKEDPDIIIHLAAHTGVLTSIENPKYDFEENTLGAFNVLSWAAKRKKPPKIIFASSGGAILGDAPIPFTEDQHCVPISPYGASKLCGESYCSAFSGSFGLTAVSLRFSNVYGTYSHLKDNIISKFIKHVYTKDYPFQIYGDGYQTRDFIHIEDLIQGIWLACITELNGFSIFNLSTMEQTTINYVIRRLKDILKEKESIIVPIEYVEKRKGEVYKNYATNKKAKKLLGFSPKIDIDKGIEKTIDWFINSKELWYE